MYGFHTPPPLATHAGDALVSWEVHDGVDWATLPSLFTPMLTV